MAVWSSHRISLLLRYSVLVNTDSSFRSVQMADELLGNLVQFVDANHFKKKPFQNIPPAPPRVSSKRQWKKYFIFKMYHTSHIRCWIVLEIAKKSKSWQNIDSWRVSVASVKNILDQHFGSGGSAWGACHHQPQFF